MDIRLGHTFSIVEASSSGILSLENKIPYKATQNDPYLLLPEPFVLATAMEYLSAGGSDRFCRWPELSGADGMVHPKGRVGRSGFPGGKACWNGSTQTAFDCLAGRTPGGAAGVCQNERPRIAALSGGKYPRQQGAAGSPMFIDREAE